MTTTSTRPNRPSWIVEAAAAGARLDRWLADATRLGSRARAADALARGRVFLEGIELTLADAGRRLAGGEQVEWWADRPGSASRRPARRFGALAVVFEDGHLIVVDKPAGLLTVPLPADPEAESVADRVAEHWRSHGRRRPAVVHRIDRDTSGLVVFARTPEAQSALKAQFLDRRAERTYLAVVRGHPAPAVGIWRDWLKWDDRVLRQRAATVRTRGAVEAICHYRIAEVFEGASLVEVRLETGKQHQIRAQAWHHGHPLVGERSYIDEGEAAATPAFGRQALHAWRLGLEHPVDGRPLRFEAPVPADFRKLLTRLRAGR
ncbi:MAG: RluA family pseudouridine synthase [Acidobacteria bacterium]|nr:RluA family pseudouridine synthase [Acidobacteriota bacterium]